VTSIYASEEHFDKPLSSDAVVIEAWAIFADERSVKELLDQLARQIWLSLDKNARRSREEEER
jgi:hypothetical protein